MSDLAPSLTTPLERLPGVGTARAQRLRALELVTVRDAIVHFPRDYKDFSGAHAFADLVEGEHASVAGTVADVRQRTTAHGRSMLTVLVEGKGGSVRGVWFNMPFMAKKFAVGATVVFAGVPKRAGTTWEMSHPEVRLCAAGEEPIRGEYLAVYPGAEGVRQSDVRLAVQAALAHAGDILEEAFPEEWLAAKGLMPIREAMHEIHAPASLEKKDAATRRLVYQELFMLQLALRLHESAHHAEGHHRIHAPAHRGARDESGHDRVVGALARPDRIGVRDLGGEACAAVLQRDAGARHNDA
jgi:ATP-dependent DNA helicase RecG